jgi:ABC-type amino acid transport substrate-binding protein
MRFALRAVLSIALLAAAPLRADDTPRTHLTLVTTTWEPYIGETLPGEGYVYQLVTRAFERAGYSTEIHFYPWARALALAREGRADGLLPEYYDERRLTEFAYSNPFPGGPVGFCARRDRHITLPPTLVEHPGAALTQLGKLRFGVVRGYLNAPAFDDRNDLIKDEARDDESNLRKLIHGRVDLAVIDRYVAEHLLGGVLKADADAVECLDPPLAQQSLYVAFPRRVPGSEAFVAAFNRGLAEVGAAAELADILQRTGLTPGR